MKNKLTEQAALEKLLSSHHLDQPIPPEIRKYIIGSMGRNYLSLLRSTGQYNLFTGLYLTCYFFIKKNGVILAFLKCLLGAAAVATLSYASYRAYEKYTGSGPAHKREIPAVSIEKPQNQPYAGPAGNKNVSPTFTMNHFEGENFSEEILMETLSIFLEEFRRTRGIGAVSPAGAEAPFVIHGTIESYGGSYAIFIKVMRKSDKSIVFSSKQVFSDREKPGVAAVWLARKIAGEVR